MLCDPCIDCNFNIKKNIYIPIVTDNILLYFNSLDIYNNILEIDFLYFLTDEYYYNYL